MQITSLKDIFSEDYLKRLGLNERQIEAVEYVKKNGSMGSIGSQRAHAKKTPPHFVHLSVPFAVLILALVALLTGRQRAKVQCEYNLCLIEKMKKKKGNTPKRRRMDRKSRLESGKIWVKNYSGKNIIKSYANWYGVDLLCAIHELRKLKIEISESYEQKVRQSIEDKKRQRENKKQKKELKDIDNFYADETFAFIAGYTSGGAPFGITYDELESMDRGEEN